MAIEIRTPQRLSSIANIFSRTRGRDEVLAGPIRGDLLGAEHLADRARTVAQEQRLVTPGTAQRATPLLARLDGTRRILDETHARLAETAAREMDVGPAGEWLLDNFHVVREHIREVRDSLPRSYYRELPVLASGPLAGYPRVYELAITLIAHTEGRVDVENVELVAGAFQEIAPLSIGELWAIPAMLRLGLIENVRRMALRTVQRLDEVESADRWALRIQEASERGNGALTSTLNEFVANPPPLSAIFVSRFLHQIHLVLGTVTSLAWLEQWIADEGLTAQDAAARSAQRLAITQVVMANSIMSLRVVGHMDWRSLIESQSVAERVLRTDPSGFYARMTFATRDRYRHVIERIAKRTGLNEADVAREAVDLASSSARESADGGGREAHIGYYLVDDGLTALEQKTGYRRPFTTRFHLWILRHPNVVYVGGILAGTLIALAAVLWLAPSEAAPAWLAIVLLALLPANEIAVGVMNRLVTAFLPPRSMPKLDLRGEGGVPAEFRTAVVIPTLFGSVDAVREALDNLEVQFLANREAHLHFAVLSDFTDAESETRDGDEAIVQAATDGVNSLNARYAAGAEDAFYLFHRPRRWNESQGVWMGWERKRGKLAEFNRFLRENVEEAFTTIVGDVAALRKVRYVITLDSDTVLPPDAAPLLVGAMAHPLNQAVYDPVLGRVVRGYGILQPRVGVSLPSAHRSLFAAIHSGHPGVDPYTTAVSDVYQDLYGEGSFTGKGIYDVDAFEQATRGRFPENTLLSHDLIEGSYARAGLVTDVEVYDDYPTRYLTYTRRKHRWIRGDWQLLRWLTPTVPGADGPRANRLSMLSKWKIFDNLRRSTVEIAQLAFLVAGWTVLPGSPLRWTLLGLAAIAAPWIASLLLAALRPPLDKSWRAYYATVLQDAETSVQQVAIAVAFLPHQAWVSADAILRTLYRLLVSRRKLLEWQTASQTERVLTGSGREIWRTMRPAVALSAFILAAVLSIELVRLSPVDGTVVFDREVLTEGISPPASERAPGQAPPRLWHIVIGVFPLITLWLLSPAVAHALSAPAIRRERRLPPARQADVRRYALLHWRFFERFVTAETNWLAPDNFQEEPSPVVAMRTSPTNIGLQLIATVSAYDLGFITLDVMTARLEGAMRSIERMRRFRGHLYNWYDLHDLRVLEPAYISTVDSGNLAGHLIALRQACLAIGDEPVFDSRVWRAIDAAAGIALERVSAVGSSGAAGTPPSWQAVNAASDWLREVQSATAAAAGPADSLDALIAPLEQAISSLTAAGLPPSALREVIEWIEWSLDLVREHRGRLNRLGVASPAANGDGTTIPTLREIARHQTIASEMTVRLEALANRAYDYAMEMDFRFLFDERRELFSIGYQQTTHSLDASYYDLLASEARLASFVAIAKNDVPVDHWFRLGRTLTRSAGSTALVSWSGSMFEYLMPVLVMQSFPFTVLDQTYHAAVRRHTAYGSEHGVPWGVSESAYNIRDRYQTYQYRAFGVPDLALKRGLGRDLVVAPYASALALMVDPQRALANLAALERKGALGPYGFRDSLDYTRPEPGQRFAIVQTYMAHHIGMGLIALTNSLTAQSWQRRFHADPMVRSAELLLHERIPRRLVLQGTQTARPDEALPDPELERPAVREIETPNTAQPHVALLGHLPYTIMVTSAGSGYSRFEGLAVTRWRADGTADNTGQFCYVRDVDRGRVWSAAHQPVCADADRYNAVLATDRVTFHRTDGDIETRTEIAVVAEDSAEVRRVTVTNNSEFTREVELTSYGEIVLAPPESDRAHPAFANLFVETEWHEWCTAITATRRPRSASERMLWCVHVVNADRDRVGRVTCETDRARFIGRGRSARNPAALDTAGELSGTTGAVLDPIFSLRTRVRLEPRQSASVAFTTLVATTRERAFELAGRYHDSYAAQRALDLAWTGAQVELRELDVTPVEAAMFQELAGHLFYSAAQLRAPQQELLRNRGSQPLLWANGISGDWPILLATIGAATGLPTLRQLLSAHQYWRRRGMMVDLVILNAHPPSYLQDLNNRIIATVFASGGSGALDQPGGVFVRRQDVLGHDDLLMLRATARVHIQCDGRSVGRILEAARPSVEVELEERDLPAAPMRPSGRSTPSGHQAIMRIHGAPLPVRRTPTTIDAPSAPVVTSAPHTGAGESLRFDNGYGGVTESGDYQLRLSGQTVPPAPWANIVANERGGFVVSESGAGATWAGNSYFYRLTPWHNDPVSDPPSEVLYLRDADTGDVWSATPAPIRHPSPYTVTHSAGSSTFEHDHRGIATSLVMGMAEHEPVKISVLRVTNRDRAPRRIAFTAYVEWTLGVMREHTQHQIQTSFSAAHNAVFGRNHFDQQFRDYVAFCAVSAPVSSFTADRREFIGRNGTVSSPAALDDGGPLSGANGGGLDPCAALQCMLELAPGETREIVTVLGAAVGEDEARRLADLYRDPRRGGVAIATAGDVWRQRLSTITVRTPEPSFDLMVNRWTLYQALACRMWGRTAVYQSSGAYGFRDQLQDVMAFVYAEPALAREHIVRAAARQFTEGDVQHWWHPHSGRGVRTRFSDDLVWLPYVVDHYVRVTGDNSVLDEYVPFLSMRALEPDEHEVYDLPQVTDEHGSIYEHCRRSLRRACTTGAHGLPLIGIGDWNDGMNRVGIDGRGESVWLAWFLITNLRSFAIHAGARADDALADWCREQAESYTEAVENNGWDGEWYRRAYFDDGTPLGSASSDECRIDSIAQSWSVISGAGSAERQIQAMESLEKHLVREDARLLMLLTPPFDETPNDPGYIKGYLPGVRENGAQYTHAALWAVMATALQGDGGRAFELYQMINPLTHGDSPEDVATYKVEPYVVAADVYTAIGQLGRGGWTWYTGSASWMYRVGLESILGFTKQGNTLVINPRVPAAWPEFTVIYRFGTSTYTITVHDPHDVRSGAMEVTIDGLLSDTDSIPLADDGLEHEVLVRPGALRQMDLHAASDR